MIPDADIIADMARADAIKRIAPGSAVSADAVFLALRLAGQKPRKYQRTDWSAPPPDWFTEALELHKGRSLTIGGFLMFSGRQNAPRTERYAVGQWPRASGRKPYKSHGDLKFRI